MKAPKVTPRSEGTVPVGYAFGPTLKDRGVARIPWNRASVLHRKGRGHFENPLGLRAQTDNVQIDPAVVEAKQKSLPRPVRRSARERAQVLATDLFNIGLPSVQQFGRPVWPTSIQTQLDSLGVGTADVYKQVDALVTHYMVKTENKQKENDQHRTTVQWHGHFD